MTLLVTLALAAELHVPGDFPTVQAAIDAADPGDEIVIAAGTYPGDVQVDVRNLTLRGAGPDATILGPGADSWAFSLFAGGESVTIEALTITGGGQRGALNGNVNVGGTHVLRDVVIRDTVNGGGLSIPDGSLVLERVRVIDNARTSSIIATFAVEDGAGLWFDGDELTVTDSVFCGNRSEGWIDPLGSAIFVGDEVESATIEGSVFVANAGSAGGAVALHAPATFLNNTFLGNEAESSPAIHVDAGGTTRIVNNLFARHRVLGGGYGPTEAVGRYAGAVSGGTNLYYDNSGGDIDGSYLPGDIWGVDPLLPPTPVDCASLVIADLRPGPGSPAIGAGDPNGGLFDDIGAVEIFDGDGDGYTLDADCDDTDPSIHPGAAEAAGDGVDANCDGVELCYVDADRDGARSTATSVSTDLDCADPGEALASAPVDCDEADPLVRPGALELCDGRDQDCDGQFDEGVVFQDYYDDADGDGWGDPDSAALSDCAPVPGRVADDGDCDDDDPGAYPGASEVPGDGIDQDCDGGDLCWLDADGDGDPVPEPVASDDLDCDDVGEAGLLLTDSDCDDADPTRYQGAPEVCDERDQDCDGLVDEGFENRWWLDADGDGAGGDAVEPVVSCVAPGADYAAVGGDCDDTDPRRSPLTPEIVDDGIDQDCDGQEACWADADRDGFGSDEEVALSADLDCDDPGEGREGSPVDCDDFDPDRFPGAAEVCNGDDDDCDGEVDEGFQLVWYTDADGDGVGGGNPLQGCFEGAGLVEVGGDCDDASAIVLPGAAEVPCDGLDNDCDPASSDDDGTCPSPKERTDGLAGAIACGCQAPGAAGGWFGLLLAAGSTRRRRPHAHRAARGIAGWRTS